MIALTSAIEPLRHANRVSGTELYRWTIYAEDGRQTRASNAIEVSVSGGFDAVCPDAIVVLCSGPDVENNTSAPLRSWLRSIARHGRDIGALCTATHILAAAGLLMERRCTIHWENTDGFRENFPDLDVTDALFEIDRDRFTCAGETAAIDLMVTMIAAQHGEGLARMVADQVLHSSVREPQQAQRNSLTSQVGTRNQQLVAAMQLMDTHIEEPLSPNELARRVGLSRRQLERVFQKHLGVSPQRHYRELRLTRARALLIQTNMSAIEVAVACGFQSPSHFSRIYRERFLHSPFEERGVFSVL
jgi:transcriptional regulator GlxA family with amidase domain